MKRIVNIIFITLIAAAGECGRDVGTGGFDGLFEKLSRARGFEQVKRYYTEGTIDALDEAADRGVIAEGDRHRLLPLFSEKTRWIELSKKTDGPRGSVRIRYTDHPVENMIGFEMDLRLRREKGGWKIDLEDEVRRALRDRSGEGVPNYLRGISRGY